MLGDTMHRMYHWFCFVMVTNGNGVEVFGSLGFDVIILLKLVALMNGKAVGRIGTMSLD